MMDRKIIRNVIIFALVVASCGWIGVGLNRLAPTPDPMQSLGVLIWLAGPLLTVLILRGLGGDGWKDFGLGLGKGWGWYALALLVYPLTVLLTLGLGSVLGVVSFDGLVARGAPALWAALAAAFAGSLVKNVFEEFSWRGYLAPRLDALGLKPLANHLLTGLVWGSWHLPYWIFFTTSAAYAGFTHLSLGWFILLGLLGLFPAALVYGELRLKTGSLWPAFLAHNVINAISAALLVSGFIKIRDAAAEAWFSPSPGGLVIILLFWAIGLWMLLRRRKA
jgi:membrane protease YdiL (CAAX protease family)